MTPSRKVLGSKPDVCKLVMPDGLPDHYAVYRKRIYTKQRHYIGCFTHKRLLNDNYSPKAKVNRGFSPLFTEPEVNNSFSIYYT